MTDRAWYMEDTTFEASRGDLHVTVGIDYEDGGVWTEADVNELYLRQ